MSGCLTLFDRFTKKMGFFYLLKKMCKIMPKYREKIGKLNRELKLI